MVAQARKACSPVRAAGAGLCRMGGFSGMRVSYEAISEGALAKAPSQNQKQSDETALALMQDLQPQSSKPIVGFDFTKHEFLIC